MLGGDICSEAEFEPRVTCRVTFVPKVGDVLMFTAVGGRVSI